MALAMSSALASFAQSDLEVMAKRVDQNQAEIVAALRKIGCRVLSLAPLGKGAPDLLVASPKRRLCLLEVKRPGERLTRFQEVFFIHWFGVPLDLVDGVEKALWYVRWVDRQLPVRR